MVSQSEKSLAEFDDLKNTSPCISSTVAPRVILTADNFLTCGSLRQAAKKALLLGSPRQNQQVANPDSDIIY